MKFVFDQPFLEQIQFFQQKGYAISPNSWRDVWQAAHSRAFTVAKVTQMDVLEDIRSELDKAMKNGMTLEEFKTNLRPALENKGWLAPKGERASVVLPGGEIRKRLTGWRLDTIYGTNLNAAYQVGRYKQQTEVKDRRPYWMYRAVMDGETRPEHAAMNGKIYPADSPEWGYIYPPNGFRCRCYVRTVSEREMKRDNLSVETEKPPMTPDKGWNFNPGKAGLDAWKPELKNYSPEALKILKPALTGAAAAAKTAGKEIDKAISEIKTGTSTMTPGGQTKPGLRDGTWGDDIRIRGTEELQNILKPGDDFFFHGNRSIGKYSGTVVKVNRKTVDINLGDYHGKPLITRVRYDEMGNSKIYIARNKVAHEVILK